MKYHQVVFAACITCGTLASTAPLAMVAPQLGLVAPFSMPPFSSSVQPLGSRSLNNDDELMARSGRGGDDRLRAPSPESSPESSKQSKSARLDDKVISWYDKTQQHRVVKTRAAAAAAPSSQSQQSDQSQAQKGRGRK